MNRRVLTKLLASVLLSCAAAHAIAHHSHSMFDHSRTVTITGAVTELSYRNPHVFLWIEAPTENGENGIWSVEMSNIQNMIRRGIRSSTFKPGDVVTVTMNPLHDGRLGGNYVSIRSADGTTYE